MVDVGVADCARAALDDELREAQVQQRKAAILRGTRANEVSVRCGAVGTIGARTTRRVRGVWCVNTLSALNNRCM